MRGKLGRVCEACGVEMVFIVVNLLLRLQTRDADDVRWIKAWSCERSRI